MMWLKIVRGSVSQITWDCTRGFNPPQKKEVAYFGTWKFGRALRFLTVLIPTSLWVKFCDTTIMCMMHALVLSYTNSWGAPIVGPGLLLTFTIFSHHSFKCTDPTTRVRGCVIMDLWVHARVESEVGLYIYIQIICVILGDGHQSLNRVSYAAYAHYRDSHSGMNDHTRHAIYCTMFWPWHTWWIILHDTAAQLGPSWFPSQQQLFLHPPPHPRTHAVSTYLPTVKQSLHLHQRLVFIW